MSKKGHLGLKISIVITEFVETSFAAFYSYKIMQWEYEHQRNLFPEQGLSLHFWYCGILPTDCWQS